MSHFDKEIKDEIKGAKEYQDLAEKHPSIASKFRKIAKDELKHKKTLEHLGKVDSSKSKALKHKLE